MKLVRKLLSLLVMAGILSSLGYGVYYYSNVGSHVFLSTTTSVQNTGLLDYLIGAFEKQHNIVVRYTAVGSGEAIQKARDGEVDAVLTHAPALEDALIVDGYATTKHTLWYNYFVIAGPSTDPAGLHSASNATEAFERLFQAGQQGLVDFYSRGDNSGTNIKEWNIWNTTPYKPDPAKMSWYRETGAGMASTLVTTDNDPLGYTLSDIGTFAFQKAGQPPLSKIIVFDHDKLLYNPYSYTIINPQKTGTDLNTADAQLFLEFLQSPSTVELVRNYTAGGVELFYPISDGT